VMRRTCLDWHHLTTIPTHFARTHARQVKLSKVQGTRQLHAAGEIVAGTAECPPRSPDERARMLFLNLRLPWRLAAMTRLPGSLVGKATVFPYSTGQAVR
jgi:hypothetical protein